MNFILSLLGYSVCNLHCMKSLFLTLGIAYAIVGIFCQQTQAQISDIPNNSSGQYIPNNSSGKYIPYSSTGKCIPNISSGKYIRYSSTG